MTAELKDNGMHRDNNSTASKRMRIFQFHALFNNQSYFLRAPYQRYLSYSQVRKFKGKILTTLEMVCKSKELIKEPKVAEN